MVKLIERIRFVDCPEPEIYLKKIDNLYKSWVLNKSPYLKSLILDEIERFQPFYPEKLLYQGINY